MTHVKTLTQVLDIFTRVFSSRAKNVKRLESDSDESLTRPNTNLHLFVQFNCHGQTPFSSFLKSPIEWGCAALCGLSLSPFHNIKVRVLFHTFNWPPAGNHVGQRTATCQRSLLSNNACKMRRLDKRRTRRDFLSWTNWYTRATAKTQTTPPSDACKNILRLVSWSCFTCM
jgi:hypothetical protein